MPDVTASYGISVDFVAFFLGIFTHIFNDETIGHVKAKKSPLICRVVA